VNKELERKWKEAVVAQLTVLSRHLSGGTEENHEKPHNSRSPGRDSNPGPPEYEAGVLTTRSRLSVEQLNTLYEWKIVIYLTTLYQLQWIFSVGG
jgi:hypothetical protein